jgi:hypothetical protein
MEDPHARIFHVDVSKPSSLRRTEQQISKNVLEERVNSQNHRLRSHFVHNKDALRQTAQRLQSIFQRTKILSCASWNMLRRTAERDR